MISPKLPEIFFGKDLEVYLSADCSVVNTKGSIVPLEPNKSIDEHRDHSIISNVDEQRILQGQYIYYYLPPPIAHESFDVADDFLKESGFQQITYKSGSTYQETLDSEQSATVLSAADRSLLQQLTSSDTASKYLKAKAKQQCFYIAPRKGMISPWASKARDILHSCGFSAKGYVERARLVWVPHWKALPEYLQERIKLEIYDPLLEDYWPYYANANALPLELIKRDLHWVELNHSDAITTLQTINKDWSLGLDQAELQYLAVLYSKSLKRDATDAELMMFAQLNSEHCRHKLFNASFTPPKGWLDSLFAMIRNTAQCAPVGVVSAYHDNAGVFGKVDGALFQCSQHNRRYENQKNRHSHWLLKVETHNHPTAISPYAGAGTGVGGELRDEAAVGRGSRSQIGLSGYSVSHLHIPSLPHDWENRSNYPTSLQSSLKIMLEAPIGAAAFANEFGRPNISGYFRCFERRDKKCHYGYHKPIMIAGGLGTVFKDNIKIPAYKAKEDKPLLIVSLGGPSLLIGIGGGSASSAHAGAFSEDLDFASVQRQNPQMQRRCQEVIDSCALLADKNPIVRIHDLGSGGWSNALPELLRELQCGGSIDLNAIPTADPELSPMELWCNESQERFVLAVYQHRWKQLQSICDRERCPVAILGKTEADKRLYVHDKKRKQVIVDLPLAALFEGIPRTNIDISAPKTSPKLKTNNTLWSSLDLAIAIPKVLSHPTVANKDFLITIADRTVGGLVCRDQMVGPWQVAVADYASTTANYDGYSGAALAIGERSPIAVNDHIASVRMAMGEALTNICPAVINQLSDIKLSVNWMCAASAPNEIQKLAEAVHDLGMKLCPELGMAVVVGKDSLSMRTMWQTPTDTLAGDPKDRYQQHQQQSPLSAIITAAAPIADVRLGLTPQLQRHPDNCLLLIDLGRGKNRMGASILEQVFINKHSSQHVSCPNMDSTEDMRHFFEIITRSIKENRILAYHDRADGGLLATLAEMCIAAQTGVQVDLSGICDSAEDIMPFLFNEELGAVIQTTVVDATVIQSYFAECGLADCVHEIARATDSNKFVISYDFEEIYNKGVNYLSKVWYETNYHMRSMRDNPQCALQEYSSIGSAGSSGLRYIYDYDANEDIGAPYVHTTKPRLAILREQGVNSSRELAAAFDRAGFECIDVHTSDLLTDTTLLSSFNGLALGGGFAYGDVFGAGVGWAQTILSNDYAREALEIFLADPSKFALGICNGCQVLSALRDLIPGSTHWPEFKPNASRQFEARLSMVEVLKSNSILFSSMHGACLPVPIAHGEGRACLSKKSQTYLQKNQCIALRYTQNMAATQNYPFNPNGSDDAIAALTNADGRINIMMPHPERAFRIVQMSWAAKGQGQDSPWLRMFRNARCWVANN